MPTCESCRHENAPGARFCQQCGARLASGCAGCGAPLATSARFCSQCGRAVDDASPAPTARGYTPRHLAERILTTRSALEGERKQVTILFADVVESTRLAERLGPEGMHELLDRVLRLMAEAVHRYEGTVNQFLGDGVMALFGAPVALEDHALRAVQAAFAVQETLGGLAEQLKGQVELRVRVGLNTGMVVVGRIGDDLRMDYTAIGDTRHLAARLQNAAGPGTILVSAATHALVEGHVRSERIGPLSLKGFDAPVTAHRLIGRRRRTRIEVSAERGLTALVGRRGELDLLSERFARVKAGRGQVVHLVGEPGVGKSRLLHELRCALANEPVVVLEGHCVAWGRATPFLPILDMLRASFQIEEPDNPLQIEEKLRRGVHELDAALEAHLPALRELFGLPGSAAAATGDARARRQRTFEAVRALTFAGTQRRPHLILFEDLHWIDPSSEDYLTFVIDSLPASMAPRL